MRSLKFTIIITLLSLQAIFSFQKAKANPLNKVEIIKHLTEKKFKFTKYFAGFQVATGWVHYRSKGRVHLQINGQDKVSGKWWVNDDNYCTKYNTKKYDGDKPRCRTISIKNKGKYELSDGVVLEIQ